MTRSYSILATMATVFLTVHASDPMDLAASDSAQILSMARLVGQTVRQCSCAESEECVANMKIQAKECSDPCFYKHAAKLTQQADQLHQCFDTKDDILQSFLTCLEHKSDGCYPTANGPQVPKTDLAGLFSIGEQKILHNTQTSETLKSLIAPISNVVEAVGDFAKCVKDCFIQKNANGFCFDHKGCQPYIPEAKAKTTLRMCTRKMQWKQQAGELCDCAVSAGIAELRDYCSLFRVMGGRTPHHRKSHRN